MNHPTKPPIYWTHIAFEQWSFYAAATAKGLCFVGSNNHSMEELSKWAQARFPGSPLMQDDEKLLPYRAELTEYLQGSRTLFTHLFDMQGTPFQLAVWQELCRIPYGQTMTYSEIAQQISRPSAVRAVGTAIGANPVLITVPCHRVIGKNGALTGYRGGMDMKARLLKLEQGCLTKEGNLSYVQSAN
ncbi:methylated-DNA--[protein]-cysteine S-methyltransferase [Paenibacillus sp. TAB 01]|uniref:methylated-DNA--[protein]-cysteine S-methyltransferase n=1 Tax=Paenibacillus sp. TAB 01 TaxID=3368988 RepID=UPI0037504506